MDSRSSTPEPLYPHPYDDGSADIVLQSCDGVDFHVLRSILSKASPFFDGMFMLPLPQRCDSGIEDDVIPTVPVSEDSETLDTLLRMCYPVQPPSLDELWHVERVVEAARKYEMDWALRSAEQALMRIANTDPLGVYATACRFGLRDAARVSARCTLRLPVSTVIEALMQEGIHGECLRNLLDYRSSCCNAALTPTHMWLWTTKAPPQFWSTHTCCTRTVVRDRVGRVYRVQPWWIRYMASISAALRETPWEGVVDTTSALALYMSDGRGTCGRCLSVAVEHISDFTCSLHAQIAAHVAKLPWTDVSS
ncbi:hypothetical protein EIP86_005296 [Pleurotus ostreatoroseus]|nr:hypothetical protein EIP86_005296 [Pleurotus ostreatoroseus]